MRTCYCPSPSNSSALAVEQPRNGVRRRILLGQSLNIVPQRPSSIRDLVNYHISYPIEKGKDKERKY
jgi:hypothetical protein